MTQRFRFTSYLALLVMVFSVFLMGMSEPAVGKGKKPAPPQITKITTVPAADETSWVPLPKGPGQLQIAVEATGANRVNFWIVPTGTDTWDQAKLVCKDTTRKDGFTCTMKYGAQETFLNHIVVEAIGPGGRAQETFNIYTKE